MLIRRARQADIPDIGRLLHQVEDVHHQGRPDLFRAGGRKYDDSQLETMLSDDSRPIFVATSPDDARVLGYAFCVLERYEGDGAHCDMLTLYIDDLCVDEAVRGRHVGTELYDHVLGFAREKGCHNVTLNVWSCNASACAFYEARGLKPYKIGMEQVL